MINSLRWLVRISESLFAHICSDAYLAGAFKLEGTDSKETADFLREFIERDNTLNPTVSNALLNLARYTERLYSSNLNWETLLDEIYQKVTALQNDDFILLPGGWAGNPGHSMIYELRKTEDGSLIFRVYNSGDGLDKHKQHLGEYDPVVSYEIPKTVLQENDFQTHFNIVIQKLLAQRTPYGDIKQPDNSAIQPFERVTHGSALYHNIISKIQYLGGTLQSRLPTPAERKKYTRGQLAGTCAQQALHEMLKEHFSDHDEYKRFMYRFKVYALECYIKELKATNDFLNPQKKILLEKGIKSNLRLLNRKAENGDYLFPDDAYKREELNRLSGYLVELNQIKKKKAVVQSDFQIEPTPEKNHDFSVSAPTFPSNDKDTPPSKNGREETPVIEETLIKSDTKDILTDLDGVITELKQLLAAGQHGEAIRRIESLIFTQLPLPKNSIIEPLKPPYTTLDTDEKIQQFFKLMGDLKKLSHKLYQDHHKQLDQSVFFESLIKHHIKLHLMTLNVHVFSAMPAYQRQPEIYKAWVQKILHYFPKLSDFENAYGMGSHHPTIDHNYKKIVALVTDPKIRIRDDKQTHSEMESATPDYIQTAELMALQKTILGNTDLIEIGKELFNIQKNEDKYLWNLRNQNSSPHNRKLDPDKLHLFLKIKNLDAAYGLLKNMPLILGYYKPCYANEKTKLTEITKILTEKETKLKQFLEEIKTILEFKKAFFHEDQDKALSEKELWQYEFGQDRFENKKLIDTTTCYLKHLLSRFDNRDDYKITRDLNYIADTFFNGNNNNDSAIMLEQHNPLARECAFLRLVPETQIPLTLDYFSKNLTHLKNRKTKIYFEINLFQPGFLYDEIKKHSDRFFPQFDSFIDSGLRLYKERNSLTIDSLFFIRMAFLVFQYAAKLEPKKYTYNLTEYYKKLNELIKTCDDNSVKMTLLKYRLMTADTITQLDPAKAALFWHFSGLMR